MAVPQFPVLWIKRTVGVAAVLYIYWFGIRISVNAIRDLPLGKETGPLGDPYPSWTLGHFVAALIFAILVLLQLWPVLRRRYPEYHRIAGRITVGLGLVTAVIGMSIPLMVSGRPLSFRLYEVFHCAVAAGFLVLGLQSARHRKFYPHRAWMIRTVAVFGIVMTQRIVFPLFPHLKPIRGDGDFWTDFEMAILLAWIINFSIAEWWIRHKPLGLRGSLRLPAQSHRLIDIAE